MIALTFISQFANITVADMLQVSWSYEFHMCLWTGIQDGVEMREQLTTALQKPAADFPNVNSIPSKPRVVKKMSLTLKASVGVKLTAYLNKQHR